MPESTNANRSVIDVFLSSIRMSPPNVIEPNRQRIASVKHFCVLQFLHAFVSIYICETLESSEIHFEIQIRITANNN